MEPGPAPVEAAVEGPECDRAVEVLANLFPDGLQFVTSSFEAQWFHSRMLLERIEREDLS